MYAGAPDLRWCQLSNIFTLNFTPITSDGYGLIQARSAHGVSTGGGQLANGVAENMHRYLDESPLNNWSQRTNPVGASSSFAVDYTYQPRGVPSPLLTAQRGVYEELSEELYWRLKDEPNRFKFLNIVMDLEYFNPHLVGIIELGIPRAEVKKHIEQTPGKDHSESTLIDFVKLDSRDSATMKLISDTSRWSAVGLSTLITAIHYWESQTGQRYGRR